jgi:alpha-beta hydrolase superfamily lysophospholipase
MPTENQWTPDTALKGFEMRRLRFPDDYDGPVYATLIRHKAENPGKKAVLYIHGYMDYFFQRHLAEAYLQHGYHFYALDLRKYGRSLEGVQHPNYCKDIQEYFAEISEAIRIIKEESRKKMETIRLCLMDIPQVA